MGKCVPNFETVLFTDSGCIERPVSFISISFNRCRMCSHRDLQYSWKWRAGKWLLEAHLELKLTGLKSAIHFNESFNWISIFVVYSHIKLDGQVNFSFIDVNSLSDAMLRLQIFCIVWFGRFCQSYAIVPSGFTTKRPRRAFKNWPKQCGLSISRRTLGMPNCIMQFLINFNAAWEPFIYDEGTACKSLTT